MSKILKFPIQNKSLKHIARDYQKMYSSRFSVNENALTDEQSIEILEKRIKICEKLNNQFKALL